MIRTVSAWLMSICLVAAVAIPLTAQAEDSAAPVLGEAAPAFTLTDTEGNEHSLSDFEGKTVVLHFQACRCPWDVAYQPQLNDIANEFADQDVVFLGINSNERKGSKEDVEEIKTYAEESEVPYAILKDTGSEVARAYHAKTTPHIFVIDGEGNLVYRGGIEEVPTSFKKVSKMETQYLEPVLTALVSGEELPYTETKSKGCSIKFAD